MIYLVSLTLLLVLAGNAMAQIDPASVTDGHVYLFENVGGNVPDDSANTHTANLIGSPQVVDGLKGKALKLNGTSDGVHIPDETTVNLSTHNNRTVIAIFKCDDVDKSKKQVVYEEGGTTRGLTIYVHEGLVYTGGWNLSDYTPEWTGTFLSAPISSNAWYAVAMVVRKGGAGQEDDKFEMWMDGELVGIGPGAELRRRSDDCAIGYHNSQVKFHDGNVISTGSYFEGIVDEIWMINAALTQVELSGFAGKVWPFAFGPTPADGTLYEDTLVNLSWSPGDSAVSHDVFLGESFDDVDSGTGGTFRGNQTGTSLLVGAAGFAYPEGLVPGTTYYWRIDEVEADGVTKHKGEVWSFFIPSSKAYNPVPPDGAKFVAADVTLTWVAGFDTRLHTVYFGDDFGAVANAVEGIPQALTRHYPGALEFDKTYYWRVDEFDGYTTHKGDVWSFTTQPDYITAATVVVIPKEGDWASSINALQPGDIGQLEAGRYLGGKTITVSGTPDKPIIIRGAGYLESIFDGESGNRALRLDNCSNLIIENITVTNPSPIGIDGRENYSSLARSQLPERDPGYSTLAEGMLITGGGSRITIRCSYFVDIATRGIIVGTGGVDDLTVEHNIFIRVSDDTSGGDVAAGSSATRMTVRENLMAGNVDGIVTHGVGAGHIFERNVIIFHRWEDGIDIKYTWKRKDEDPWTIIRNNVIYSYLSRGTGIAIHMGSDNVRVYGNVFHGTGGGETILIRGRNGSDGIVGNVENHEIVGNWFDFKPGYNDSGNAFRIHQYTADPSDISNVYILHNVFTGGHRIGGMRHGSNLNVYNNIFESTTFGSFTADVAAGTNLYHNTAVWGIDTEPIVGEPVYTDNPVGPLAEGSPGKGRATKLRGHDLGNDVGLPQSTVNLVTLEISILQSLEEHFTYEDIKEAMGQGGVSYDDDGDRLFDLWEKYYFGSPATCDPNADPDNDGIANREEYANGTGPLDPNSVP